LAFHGGRRRSSDASVGKAERGHLFGPINVPNVDDDRLAHRGFDAGQIEHPERFPFGDDDSPQARTTRSAIERLRFSLMSMTVSINRGGEPAWRAVSARASISLGKQEPPTPGPALRNLAPMRAQRIGDNFAKTRLIDRDSPGQQTGDLGLVLVDADNLMAEVGEARSRGQPDITNSNHRQTQRPTFGSTGLASIGDLGARQRRRACESSRFVWADGGAKLARPERQPRGGEETSP
jgi:hypothetical protein